MIDAKLKGEGIDLEAEVPETGDTNVIDHMAALKKSLGQASDTKPQVAAPATEKRKKASGDERKQQALKLPMKGGKARADATVTEPKAGPVRKRA